MSPVKCTIHQNCKVDEFCNYNIQRCETCVVLCNPKKGTLAMEQCKLKCQDYYYLKHFDRMPFTNRIETSSLRTTSLTSSTIQQPEAQKIEGGLGGSHIALFVVIALVVFIVILFIVVLVFVVWKWWRTKRPLPTERSSIEESCELEPMNRNNDDITSVVSIEIDRTNDIDNNANAQHQNEGSARLLSEPSCSYQLDDQPAHSSEGNTVDPLGASESNMLGTNQSIVSHATVHNETSVNPQKKGSRGKSITRSKSEMLAGHSKHKSKSNSIPRPKSTTMSKLGNNSGNINNDSMQKSTAVVKSKSACTSENRSKGDGKTISSNTGSLSAKQPQSYSKSGKGSVKQTSEKGSIKQTTSSKGKAGPSSVAKSSSKAGPNSTTQSSKTGPNSRLL